LLFLARAEDLHRDLQIESLEALPALHGMVDFYEASASESGIFLAVNEADAAKIHLRAEKTLFQQSIGNLLSNAIRYTPSGGRIEVRVDSDGTNARIFVHDTGIGIPPEHVPHLTDRFYRADSSRNHSSGGVGLGLAITKSIVELHGGRIEITSELGRGTTVTLIWPTWPYRSANVVANDSQA
jgi:two-component system heavy metal sensor histidine kinase CusS